MLNKMGFGFPFPPLVTLTKGEVNKFQSLLDPKVSFEIWLDFKANRDGLILFKLYCNKVLKNRETTF